MSGTCGAIDILNSSSPDKIAQAAHSLRELCDHLPKYIANVPQATQIVSEIKQHRTRFIRAKATDYADSWLNKPINKALDEVLRSFETIFAEPPRTKRFQQALTLSDPQPELMSKDLLKKRDDTFEELVGFFQNVAHHNRLPTAVEFQKQVDMFESLVPKLPYAMYGVATNRAEVPDGWRSNSRST